MNDLLTFSNTLFEGGLLTKETVALMTKSGLDDYGCGLWSYETTINHRVVKRPGQIMGEQAQLYRLLDDDVNVIILSNTGTAELDEFVAEIGKRAVG
ncbi:MAG TPA: hypothetical protein VH988_14355 [Thermoanaerobaculia bacterium]|nr:hypothetical protein [Thermoanaerobaculia bacterium]